MISTGTSGTTVAVKMLKEGHTDNDMIDLVSIYLRFIQLGGFLSRKICTSVNDGINDILEPCPPPPLKVSDMNTLVDS